MTGVTLKQLAEKSGFSVRTVSRVLKNEANVSPEKREKILTLAKELHYVPNTAARNLRLNRRSIVGILCKDYAQEIAVQKLHDLERRLGACSYYPLLGHYDGNMEHLAALLSDWAGLIDFAVVLNVTREISCGGSTFPFRTFPIRFLFVDCDNAPPECDSLQIDRASGICEGVTHLIRTGHRRIVHCGSLESRSIGFQRAFELFPGENAPEKLRCISGIEFSDGEACAGKLLEQKADAVFFDTDRMALGFLSSAAERGIRVPQEIAVIGFDDDPAGRMHYPALSTVAHPIHEINAEILRIIQGGPASPVVHKVFPSRFIRRASS